jgi:hypothetical protein
MVKAQMLTREAEGSTFSMICQENGADWKQMGESDGVVAMKLPKSVSMRVVDQEHDNAYVSAGSWRTGWDDWKRTN